jgi:dTDP-4-amino-4,6-dideoxygalactose transaminase
MGPLVEAAKKYNLVLVEDATESLGATYKGRSAGTLGDIGCFSFNGNKLITTGGGGMIVTDNEEWARKARYLTTQAKDDPLEYVHNEIGYNYRLTNVQAAIGCAQLERISEHIASKRSAAADYAEALKGVSGVECMAEAAWAKSTFWLFTVLVDEAGFGMDSRELQRLLHSERVQARPLWQPLHLSAAHKDSPSYGCTVAATVWRKALSLPSSVGITRTDVIRVAELVSGLAKN